MDKTENPLMSGRPSDSSAPAQPFDWCIVFPKAAMDPGGKGPDIVQAVQEAACQIYLYWSHDKDQVFMLIRVPDVVLQAFADAIDFRVLLREDALITASTTGGNQIKPFEISHMPEVTPIFPYQLIYSEYKLDPTLKQFYTTPFPVSVRLKLTALLLIAGTAQRGADLEPRVLMLDKTIDGYFPLHDSETKNILSADWLNWYSMPWNQPVDGVKDYFGEKIGLYFTFLGHYCSWLMLPAVLGLAIQLVVAGTGNFSHPILPFFALLIAGWAVFMLEFWKRKQAMTAFQWGMEGFEEEQLDRPEFKGLGEGEYPQIDSDGKTSGTITSFIDGSQTKFFPPKKQAILMAQSFAAIGTLATIVLAVIITIYVIRRLMYSTSVGTLSSTVASIMNSVQIAIFNVIYSKVANYLTDRENHRTDTTYEDSMIAKLFMFQFVNSYTSFFYLAFVAKYVARPEGSDDDATGECGYNDCMIALAINLAIVFGTRLTLGNVLELLEPYLKGLLRQREEKVDVSTLSPAEQEFLLEPYDLLVGCLNDYAELAIQFGYMSFFVTALPAAVFGAFLNNFVEIRTDAYKLLSGRRPILQGAEDIGTWQAVFTLIAGLSVVTNAGIVSFTMSIFDSYSVSVRMWLFIGFQWLLFTLQYIIEVAVPDEPYEVQVQKKRTNHIINKIILKIPDDEIDSVKTSRRASVKTAESIIHDAAPLPMTA